MISSDSNHSSTSLDDSPMTMCKSVMRLASALSACLRAISRMDWVTRSRACGRLYPLTDTVPPPEGGGCLTQVRSLNQAYKSLKATDCLCVCFRQYFLYQITYFSRFFIRNVIAHLSTIALTRHNSKHRQLTRLLILPNPSMISLTVIGRSRRICKICRRVALPSLYETLPEYRYAPWWPL